MAEESHRQKHCPVNLLDSLPHLEWTQSLHLQGKQWLGMQERASETRIYNSIETHSPSSQHDPAVYYNLIKLNTN